MEKSLLKFIRIDNKYVLEILGWKEKNYDDEHGEIGDHLIVECLISVPDTSIPMNNMFGEEKRTCLVNKNQFQQWMDTENRIKWI